MDFSHLPVPTPDPLFSIAAEAQAAGKVAINGTIGVFMDEAGKPLLFPSVQKAIGDLSKILTVSSYSYPPLLGLPEFRSAVARLLPKPDGFLASIASTGGTGALAINLRLMRMLLAGDHPSLILPVPAWGNHPPLCLSAGFAIKEAAYVIAGKASVDGILDAINSCEGSFGILLQVGCHNPTGLDLSSEDWRLLASRLQEKEAVVLLDFAYQGFIGDPKDDASPIQFFLDAKIPTLITWSASKNHSIYGLRTGLACAYVPDEKLCAVVEGHYCSITRSLHSASATIGQAIVARVQQDYHKEWLTDLEYARKVMLDKRELLKQYLPATFQASLAGHGMFAQLPLKREQILKLKREYNVFMTLDGRINIAGIPHVRIEELCEKIRLVLSESSTT